MRYAKYAITAISDGFASYQNIALRNEPSHSFSLNTHDRSKSGLMKVGSTPAHWNSTIPCASKPAAIKRRRTFVVLNIAEILIFFKERNNTTERIIAITTHRIQRKIEPPSGEVFKAFRNITVSTPSLTTLKNAIVPITQSSLFKSADSTFDLI
jgi:hypothetical protein